MAQQLNGEGQTQSESNPCPEHEGLRRIPQAAKEKEITRLMDILKLDLEEKNLLPPREQNTVL